MPGEEIAITTAIAVGGYVGTKLFGTALATMGDDINKLYVKGRDKIVEVATKKVDNPDDGKKVNLRAARDVLWNGAITEDEVCAEYFGGMLAAARSEDGKDDAVVHYVDTIKAMSARQLELHYVIYTAWQSLLNQGGKPINLALSADVQAWHIFMNGLELSGRQLPYDRDLTVLYRLGLVVEFKYDNHVVGDKTMPFVDVAPTTFGVMLFAVAHNKLATWRSFSNELYESATGIRPINYYAENLEKLCIASGMLFKVQPCSRGELRDTAARPLTSTLNSYPLAMRHQGRITTWKDDKGFGFIAPNGGGEQVFVHISSFSNRERPPEGNELVTYELKADGKRRAQANTVAFVGEKPAPPVAVTSPRYWPFAFWHLSLSQLSPAASRLLFLRFTLSQVSPLSSLTLSTSQPP